MHTKVLPVPATVSLINHLSQLAALPLTQFRSQSKESSSTFLCPWSHSTPISKSSAGPNCYNIQICPNLGHISTLPWLPPSPILSLWPQLKIILLPFLPLPFISWQQSKLSPKILISLCLSSAEDPWMASHYPGIKSKCLAIANKVSMNQPPPTSVSRIHSPATLVSLGVSPTPNTFLI